MDRLLVIGGTSGIGQEVAHLARTSLEPSTPRFSEVIAVDEDDCDVRIPSEVADLVDLTRPTHVVYSAGVNNLKWIKDISKDDFSELLAVNVIGFQYLLTSLLRLRLTQAPSIVAIGSDAADRPMRTSLMYCASKAALNMAVRCAARELGPLGWRVNSVSPGKVADTGMTDYVDRTVPELRGWTPEYALTYELSSTPLGRYITKEEVAWSVLDVLSGPAAVNGANIVINGGR